MKMKLANGEMLDLELKLAADTTRWPTLYANGGGHKNAAGFQTEVSQ